MKFVCNFYFYVLIIIFTRGIWVVQCSTDFQVAELKYLSKKLDPTECLKLLDALYQRTSFKQKMARAEKINKAIRRDFGKSWVTRENCLFELENWHRNFPGRGNIKGREAMAEALRSLGRPDLGKKIRQNRRENFPDYMDSEYFFENNEHDMSRRYAPNNEKSDSYNKKKHIERRGQGKKVRYHKIQLEGIDNGNLHPVQIVATGEILKDNHSGITDRKEITKETPEMNHDIYWIILVTVIALIIMSICATGVLFIYRKNCNQLINGRLCQEWALNQEGKEMCVCCCGKRKETNRKSYTDVDMESGWSGSCSKWWLDPQGDNYEKSRSKQETIFQQKPKKLKKKRKLSRTKERIHKKEEKKAARNKTLEKEMKFQKYKSRNAISEPSYTNFKEVQKKIDRLLKNECECCKCPCTSEDQRKYTFFKKKAPCDDPLCNKYNLKNKTDLSLSSETECITTSRKDKKKEKSRWSSCDTSPRLKDKKRAKEPKNKEKLFQYASGSPCSRKTCDWMKIAKEKRHGKNSV